MKKYYAIVPIGGKDRVEGVFRERDDGMYEQWNTRDKQWQIGGYEYMFGSDIGFRATSDEEVKAFTGE